MIRKIILSTLLLFGVFLLYVGTVSYPGISYLIDHPEAFFLFLVVLYLLLFNPRRGR